MRQEEIKTPDLSEEISDDSPKEQDKEAAEDHSDLMTRRDFLKTAAQTVLAIGAGRLVGHLLGSSIQDTLEETQKPEVVLTPETIENIPVYGLKEPITSFKQIKRFYKSIDETPNMSPDEKFLKRKEALNPKERYLEIAVLKSAYDSFARRKSETGVGFVEWMKMTTDTMNVCFANAKPPSEIKAVLKRILVVPDNVADEFWDKDAFNNGKGNNFDFTWLGKTKEILPLSTDISWGISLDYRVNPNNNIDNIGHGGSFWSCTCKNNCFSFEYPPGGTQKEKALEYPVQNNSLVNSNGTWLDCGQSHELLHYLFNLPDEYGFDLHLNNGQHLVVATGSFQKPWVSPYLSLLSKHHIEKKLRDCIREGCGNGYSFQDIPENIAIKSSEFAEVQNIKVVRMSNDINERILEEIPSALAIDRTITASKEQLVRDREYILQLNYLDKTKNKNIGLYIPYLPFIMSKLRGLDDPQFQIIPFGEGVFDPKKEQVMYLFDESDAASKIEEEKRLYGFTPFAAMKVSGTNAWCIWAQQFI